jgi:outer membrane protein OmpA-like peptidoglycan-associated protein
MSDFKSRRKSAANNVLLSKITSNRGAGEGNLFTVIFMVCLALLLVWQLKYCSPTPPKPAAPPAAAPADLASVLKSAVILFDKGSAQIKADKMAILKGVDEAVKAAPKGTIVEVAGYTDSRGAAAMNKQLSQNRAEAVRAALVKMGVDAGALKAKGYGAEKPIATNDTEEGRQKNRRAEFMIAK